MQTQDPLSPGCIRRRSGVNGIIHVLKTTRTLELFLRQRCCCVSSPNHLSICTYSTSHEVHKTAVNINNGNIKAPFQVQDCKWYFYLLLSTYLFIKCIRKSIKEEIKDLGHHSNPVFQIQTLNIAQPLHLILSYDSVEVGSGDETAPSTLQAGERPAAKAAEGLRTAAVQAGQERGLRPLCWKPGAAAKGQRALLWHVYTRICI